MSKILIAGTGPVGVQIAHLCNQYTKGLVSMAGRATISAKSNKFFEAYKLSGFIEVEVQNENHSFLSGKTKLNRLYPDYNSVNGLYDVLVMACTANAYREVLLSLQSCTLKSLKCIILVSPTLGSHIIVQQLMNDMHLKVEVVSFSTYFGDTRVSDIENSNCVVTTGVKEHIYLGSTIKESKVIAKISTIFQKMSIKISIVSSPFIAESRNSSLYVHPALFMNDFALQTIFYGKPIPVFVYKLFPEGPITMALIKEMRLMWQEVMNLLKALELPSFNLLKFMVTENYPLRPETMENHDIEIFESLSSIHQEYLLYVRYTAILIDPFSLPNDKGAYFDFSAVPFKSVYKNKEGIFQIPRMPSEDYYRTKIIQELGHSLHIETPMIDQLMSRYVSYITEFEDNYRDEIYSSDFNLGVVQHDVDLLKTYLKNNR